MLELRISAWIFREHIRYRLRWKRSGNVCWTSRRCNTPSPDWNAWRLWSLQNSTLTLLRCASNRLRCAEFTMDGSWWMISTTPHPIVYHLRETGNTTHFRGYGTYV